VQLLYELLDFVGHFHPVECMATFEHGHRGQETWQQQHCLLNSNKRSMRASYQKSIGVLNEQCVKVA